MNLLTSRLRKSSGAVRSHAVTGFPRDALISHGGCRPARLWAPMAADGECRKEPSPRTHAHPELKPARRSDKGDKIPSCLYLVLDR